MPADIRRAQHPRAHPARRRRVGRRARARLRRLADHGSPRPRATRARRADRARPRRRAPARQRSRGAPCGDRLDEAAQAGPGREKEAIAARAAEFVEDGSTIFVDSSTTLPRPRPPSRAPSAARAHARDELPGDRASSFRPSRSTSIVTPGEVDQTLRMIGGRWAAEFLAGLNMETAFVSAGGVTLENGLTTTRRALADTLNAAIGFLERRRSASIDSSKFGLSALLCDRAPGGARRPGRRRWPPAARRSTSIEAAGVNLDRRPTASDRCFHHRLRRTREWHDPSRSSPASGPTCRWRSWPSKAAAWGFDGLELACWGDHFDVDEALADPTATRTAAARSSTATASSASRSRRTSSARRSATRSTSVTGRSCRPDVWGDGDPEGVRQPGGRQGEGHGARGREVRRHAR